MACCDSGMAQRTRFAQVNCVLWPSFHNTIEVIDLQLVQDFEAEADELIELMHDFTTLPRQWT